MPSKRMVDPCSDLREIEVQETRRVWRFPDHPFVQYEPKDEVWARPLGIGREVEETTTWTTKRALLAGDRNGFHFEIIPPITPIFRSAYIKPA